MQPCKCVVYTMMFGNSGHSIVFKNVNLSLRCCSLAAHVFFDDAMEVDDDEERVVNGFVKLLVTCMDEAARCVPTFSKI